MKKHIRDRSFDLIKCIFEPKTKFIIFIKLVIVFCISCFNLSHAEQRFSCKAASTSGEFDDFNFRQYADTFPTILINFETGKLIYLYYKLDQRWESEYSIVKREEPFLIAIDKFQTDWISIIHVNTQKKIFTRFYAGNNGNTMTFGKCD